MSHWLEILDWALKTSATMLAAWAAVSCWPGRPRFRRLIWVCAFAGSLLLPLANVVPNQHAMVLKSMPVVSVASQPMAALADVLPALWLIGALLALAWLGAGYVGLVRTARRSDPFTGYTGELRPVGLGRRWQVRISRDGRVVSPVTFGFFRPVILLPQGANSWSEEQLRAVAVHELEHVRNLDSGAVLLAYALCAMLWFNPLVWLALGAMRAECEAAADEAVVDAGLAPSAYASLLLSIAAQMGSRPVHGLALSMARTRTLEHRILTIIGVRRRRPAKTWQRLGTVGAFAIVLGGIGSCRLAEAQASQPPGHSFEWQEGFNLAKTYRATHPAGETTAKPPLTEEQRRELERRLIRNQRPPPG